MHTAITARRVGRLAGQTLLLGAFLASTASAGSPVYVHEYRMHIGDQADCGSQRLDDAAWPLVNLRDLPHADTPVCLRATVVLAEEPARGHTPLAVAIGALASSEIWWDGEPIGSAGSPGANAESEIPGPIESLHVIPERLALAGPHTLSLRVSAFHRHFEPSRGYWYVLIADYGAMLKSQTRETRLALFALSGILMAGLFSLMLYAIDRSDRSFLFLALLCLTAAALSVAESWRALFGYTYDWHLLRLVIVTGLAVLLDVLLLVFLARRFPMSGARWFVGAGVVLAIIPVFAARSWDPKVLMGFVAVFSLALLWTLRAVLQRRSGGLLAFLGLLPAIVLLLWNRGDFVEGNLYVAVDILLLFLFGSHAIQVRQVRQEREQARLKSARLELELLRRHIQPHFLMNTLTALSEWVEQEPEVASRMIQALSEEFRVLSDIADRDVIPVEEEIRLCRCHLEIMSHRKGRRYAMATEGLDPKASIPPAVFHTLVENAITHNHYRQAAVEFCLSAERNGHTTRYVFESPLGQDATLDRPAAEGTGLRYVRARLHEAFGQGWSLESAARGNCWRTEIVVPTTG